MSTAIGRHFPKGRVTPRRSYFPIFREFPPLVLPRLVFSGPIYTAIDPFTFYILRFAWFLSSRVKYVYFHNSFPYPSYLVIDRT